MLRDSARAPLDLAPPAPRPQRTGRTAIERAAVARVSEAVAAMPASLVVQLALWPDELARWARAERAAESLVYNMLAGRKPYVRTRERLAARLGVPTGVLAQLIEAAPAPLDAAGRARPRPLAPGELAWRQRRGANPIELAARHGVEREIAAMPAATVVGLALWPETLTAWARSEGLHASAVWAALAGTPSELVTRRLAGRLGVAWRELIGLIEAERLPAGSPPAPGARGAPGPTGASPAVPGVPAAVPDAEIDAERGREASAPPAAHADGAADAAAAARAAPPAVAPPFRPARPPRRPPSDDQLGFDLR